MLRACERLGINPFTQWRAMTAGEQALALAYDWARRKEQAAKDAAGAPA